MSDLTKSLIKTMERYKKHPNCAIEVKMKFQKNSKGVLKQNVVIGDCEYNGDINLEHEVEEIQVLACYTTKVHKGTETRKKCQNFLHLINNKYAVLLSGSPPLSTIDNVHETFIPNIVFDKTGNPRFRFEDCVYYKVPKNQTKTHYFRCNRDHGTNKICVNCESGTRDDETDEYHLRFTSGHQLIQSSGEIITKKVQIEELTSG